MKKILFVCTGNICRSPTAQAVFEKMSQNIPELADWIAESAGTHGTFAGYAPHPETMKVAEAKGYVLDHIRSRQLTLKDFEEAEFLYAMAEDHFHFMKSLAPQKFHKKIRLFMDYAPKRINTEHKKNTPDPLEGFRRNHMDVLTLIEAVMPEIIASLKAHAKKN